MATLGGFKEQPRLKILESKIKRRGFYGIQGNRA